MSVASTAEVLRGAAATSRKPAIGRYELSFPRTTADCVPVATLADNRDPQGSQAEPPAGRITVGPFNGGIVVKTFDADGTPRDIGFNLHVIC